MTAGMSRPVRILHPGLIYHVMARGNNKMPIFLDDLDYARFIGILDDVRQEYALDLWLLCAMPNHHHAVFRTRRANLSLAMQQLHGTYARWWNKRHGHVGHVYQGRFKAQIVEACTYLVRLCRYVLMNPVRAKLVSHPAEWRWSSYGALTGARATCVDIDSLLAAIDPDASIARGQLLDYVDGYADLEMDRLVRTDQRILGSDAFARGFAVDTRRASREVPLRERRSGTTPLASLLAEALTRGGGLKAGVLDAVAAQYQIQEIAQCAGLSPRTVARILRGDIPSRRALVPTSRVS